MIDSPADPRCGAQGSPLRAISVIMPVFNGAGVLPKSLPPLLAMREAGEIAEVIVADDGSTDDTAAVASAMGVRVIASGGRLGPGGARNAAAPQACGDVLWFVDADVVVHADAARTLARALDQDAAAAVFGCYDDRPAADNFLSQYKNLVHHYYHARAAGEADTFWAGCGAIRKDAFMSCGGFDAAAYPHPSIEDIELGYRLRRRGFRIVLSPALQGTHLKVWRLGNLLHTDIYRRALPWSRLILGGGGLPNSLNVDAGERANAALAAALAFSVPLALLRVAPAWLPLGFVAAAMVANRRMFATFRRARGTAFALAAVLFHQIYYLYSSAAFAWCWLERRGRRRAVDCR